MNAKAWVRPVVLAVSCLILGFVGGWSLATIGGDEVALPAANVDVTVEEPAPSTTNVTETEATPPARDAVAIQVLNGTTTDGLAAKTATTIKSLGYTKVAVDTGPSQTGPTTIYYRDNQKLAAEQLAKDMQLTEVQPIAGTPLETSAAASAQVIVLLGAQ